MELEPLLKSMIAGKASDIFIVAGAPITYSVNGRLVRTDGGILRPEETQAIVGSLYRLANRDFDMMLTNVNHDED